MTSKGKSRLAKAAPLWANAQAAIEDKLGARDWSTVHRGLEQLIVAS
jgi:hypothetical protein